MDNVSSTQTNMDHINPLVNAKSGSTVKNVTVGNLNLQNSKK